MERIRQKPLGDYQFTIATVDDDGLPVAPEEPAVAGILNSAPTPEAVFEEASPTIDAEAKTLAFTVPNLNLTVYDTYLVLCSFAVSGAMVGLEQRFELCGGYLFELPELRASDPAFASTTAYPDAAIKAARVAAEQLLEDAARVAFVPRARRLTTIGDGSSRLTLPDNAVRRVRSASIAGTALTAAELAALVVHEWGALDRPSGSVWGEGEEVVLFYEHGYDYPPEPVREAAVVLARDFLVRSNLASRATVEQTDVGFFRLSVAGNGRIGIPFVDAIVDEFGRRRPQVG